MSKLKVILFILLAMLFISTPGNAAMVSCLGSPNSSGSCPIEIDSDSKITFPGTYIQKYEVVTTNDTLTAADSGTVFLIGGSSATDLNTKTYTLPTAAAGLTYTFTATDGHATAPRGRIYVDPAITDKMVGCVSSTVTSTFAVGDSLYSPGATGDSLTIVGYPLFWYCTDRIGVWVDGNTAAGN